MSTKYRQLPPEAQALMLSVSAFNRHDRELLTNGFWDYTIDLEKSRWFHPAYAPIEAALRFQQAWDLAIGGKTLQLSGVVCLIGHQNAILFTPETVGTFDAFEDGQYELESMQALNLRGRPILRCIQNGVA